MPGLHEEVDDQQKGEGGKGCFEIAEEKLPGAERDYEEDKDAKYDSGKFIHCAMVH